MSYLYLNENKLQCIPNLATQKCCPFKESYLITDVDHLFVQVTQHIHCPPHLLALLMKIRTKVLKKEFSFWRSSFIPHS